jgi:O-antigen/teichoic acid export membrane protein
VTATTLPKPPSPRPLPAASPTRGAAGAAAWTLSGALLAVGCQAAVVVVLARLATPDALGDYALTTAVGAPIWMLVGLQLPSLKATDVRAAFQLREYLAVRLASAILGVAMTSALTLATGATVGRIASVVAISLWRAADFVAEIGYAEFQLRARADLQAKSQILRGALGITTFSVALAVSRNAAFSFTALALSSTLVFAAHDLVNLRRTSQDGALFPVFRQRTWGLVRYGLPLGLVVVLAALITNVPRYAIEATVGHAALGAYAAVATLAALGTVAIAALNQVAGPRLAHAWALGDMRSARRILLALVSVGVGIGGAAATAVWLVGDPTLVFVFGPRFSGHQMLLIVLLAGATITCVTNSLGAGATAFRSIAPQVAINGATLCVAAASAPLLIRRYGLEGAAISQVLAGLCALGLFGALIAAAMRKRAGSVCDAVMDTGAPRPPGDVAGDLRYL